MKMRSSFSNPAFQDHTTSCLIQQRLGSNTRLKNWGRKIINQYRAIFLNATAMVFTGTVFLGGSYFFFIQLAEYGW